MYKTLIIIATILFTLQPVQARILFQDDDFQDFNSPGILLDSNGDDSIPTSIQFGNNVDPALNASIKFNFADQILEFSHNVSLLQNQLKALTLENASIAPLNPTAGQIYHNTVDGNTYIYNGTIWEDITALNSTSTKVVTVGPGLDYADIEAAAGYLNTLSGGIILLSADDNGIPHAVTTEINLENITIIGKGSDRTTVNVTGPGQIDSFDTNFVDLTIDVDSINDTMAIDVQSGSNSLIFDRVSFSVLDVADSLVDSNAGTSPIVSIRFIKGNQDSNPGSLLKAVGTGNLDSSSFIFVDGRSGEGVLNVNDWDVTIAEAGNVLTSGTITTIPERSIFVSPNMNLQGAVDSLVASGNGGLITLLPGIYEISQPLVIATDGINPADNIQITGYGDASIIRASGFGATGESIGAVQVGLANGLAPANGVVLRDFKLEVVSNIHGVRVAGGSDNQLLNLTIQKTAGASGSGATADIGIQMLDSVGGNLARALIKNCRVLGNGGSNYFTDGIHITSGSAIVGVFGYGNRAENILVEGNNVDYVRETSYVFVGADDSSLFNNRASRMGVAAGTPYGIFIGDARNINMNANVFAGSLDSDTIAIGIESFNTGATTEDSLFNNNVIDGSSNGVGFNKGFELGNGSSFVIGSSFQNNTIKGASAGADTVAFEVRGNSDDNSIINNQISGAGNNWDRGIDLQSATQDRTIIRDNRYTDVTARIIDDGSNTTIGVSQHRESVDPTLNDDINENHQTGEIWINTSSDEAFILTDEAGGAADWKQITTPMKMGQFYNSDGAGGSFNINTPDWTAIPWNSESFPEDDAYSHDQVTNNSQVQILKDGLYQISYQINHETQGGRRNVRCRIRIDGTSFPLVSGDSFSYSRNGTDKWASNTANAILDLSAGEYYEIVCRQEGTSGDAYLAAGAAEGISWTMIEKIK